MTDDDDLADRLRAGLAVVAREAGDPPPFARAAASLPSEPARRPRRAWLATAAIATVAAVVIGGLFAVSRRDSEQQVASGDGATGGSRPLLDTSWWLRSATADGADVAISTTGTPSYWLRFLDGGSCEGIDAGCYDGPRLEASDACNGVTRKTTIEGDRVTLGEDYGVHTAMGCPDDGLPGAMAAFFAGDAFTYALDGDQLVLTSASGDIQLSYQAIDTPFGPTSSRVVDDGEIGDHAYRLVWEAGALDFQATEWGSAGVGADPGRVNAMRDDIEGHSYLFGIVPATAARVVYEPAGGEPQELAVVDVGDEEFAVIGQVVDVAPASWDVVAYDAAGNEIHRLQWG